MHLTTYTASTLLALGVLFASIGAGLGWVLRGVGVLAEKTQHLFLFVFAWLLVAFALVFGAVAVVLYFVFTQALPIKA